MGAMYVEGLMYKRGERHVSDHMSTIVASERMRVAADSDDMSDPLREHDKTDAKRDACGRSGSLQGPPGNKVHTM